jgi:Flp pilus assembly protein TadG
MSAGSTPRACSAPRGHFERGSVLVEFALASIVVMSMLFGMIECGRALFSYHLVSNAARLGSRYAIVHGTDCSQTLASCAAASSSQIQTYVRGVSPGVDPAALTVDTTYATGTACLGSPYEGSGCTVSVQVSYTFRSLLPLLDLAAIPMSSTSTMVISQ